MSLSSSRYGVPRRLSESGPLEKAELALERADAELYQCKFRAFSKGPLSLNLRGTPYLLELSDITDRVAEAEAMGATEVCLQGGIHPKFDGDYYLEVIRAVRQGRRPSTSTDSPPSR